MSFLKRITSLFSGGRSSAGSDRMLPIYVLSRRCNEPIAGQIDLMNELSQAEEDSGFYTRKVLHTSGERRCFDQVEVEIWFDGNKRISHHEVVGGRWLSAEEYEAELARIDAPANTPVDASTGAGDDSQAGGAANQGAASKQE